MTARRRLGRGTLATRMMLATTAVAVIAGVLAAFIAVGLIRSSADRSSKAALHRLADAVAEVARSDDNLQSGQRRARSQLAALKVTFAAINATGKVTGGPLARAALTDAEIAQVRDGRSLSITRRVDGTRVFIEARHTPIGGLILVQRSSDALGFGPAQQKRLFLGVLIGVAVAALVGLLMAALLARPLRRTAAAAHALAAGRRDVVVAPTGPAEIAEVSAAINGLAESLSYSEGRQRDFLLSVSHDLRTPLTAIRGYAESVADGVVRGDSAQQAGTVIVAEAQRLERLVADLLDLARLGAADFRVDLRPVDLRSVLDGVAATWQPRCTAAGVRFGVDRPEQPVLVTTDASRLRQAVDGLLENALRVVPTGAPVVVAARAVPAGGVLEVRDGGPGLADDDLDVAFERGALYQRYRGVRPVGTGLGLAIVAGLIDRVGGHIAAGHAPEGGARFTVTLPPAASAAPNGS